MATASQLWAGAGSSSGAQLSALCRVRQRVGGERAAEGLVGEDDARARVRRRASGGDGDEDAIIL